MLSPYLICYDIRDQRRLARTYRYLKGQGIHVQYSVFHCRLTYPELLQLKDTLNGIIDEEKDDVRIYPLPSDGSITIFGCGDRVPEGVNIFLT